jgi:hypothetical protein
MITEPIGATLTKHPDSTRSALWGLTGALLVGAIGVAIPLAMGTITNLVWGALHPPSDTTTLSSRPWVGSVFWNPVIIYMGWAGTLTGLVRFSREQSPGWLRSIRIAIVSTLLALLVLCYAFPLGFDFADDTDAEIRIAAGFALSVGFVFALRDSPTWDW